MFNTYTDAKTTNYAPDKIEHHEYRAPTDESIRLAKEYEKEITKKIVGQVVFGENVLEFPKGQALYIRRNDASISHDTYICFKLNGKLYEKKLAMHSSDWTGCNNNNNNNRSVLNVFIKKLTEAIVEEIIGDALKTRELDDLLNIHT